MSWLSRVTNTFRTQKLDQDLYDELQFHLEERVDELIRRGHSLEEAEQEALRNLGNPHRAVESSRDAKLATWLASFLQDARFGCRLFLRRPISFAAVVLSLSLAIGAATTVFSLIDALLLRSLSVAHPENLIYLSYSGPGNGGGVRAGENVNFSLPMLDRLRRANVPGLTLFGVSYGGPRQSIRYQQEGGAQESVRPQWISGNGFDVLALTPFLGRLLTESDEWPEGESVAVLSYRYWESRFHSDSSVLGARIHLSIRGVPSGTYRIVGVAPRNFDGLEPGAPADLWFPLSTRVGSRAARSPELTYLQIRGRMTGNTGAIQKHLQSVFGAFRKEHENVLLHPSFSADDFRAAEIGVFPASDIPSYIRTRYRQPLWLVAAIVVLVLIVACTNIANLLIARAAGREREMALRVAIGADRIRLVRQMLIESGLLAAAACAGALVCSYFAGPAIVTHLGPADFPVFLDLRPDGRLLGFLLGIGVAATLLFGLLPAWRSSAVPPAAVLRASSMESAFTGSFLKPLFTVQVSVGFVVLYLSGLLISSFQALDHIDPGFPTDHVSLWTVGGTGDAAATNAFLASVRQWPGVQGAGFSSCPFVDPAAASAMIFPPGRAAGVRVAHMGVSPGFLPAMAVRLTRGRDIGSEDLRGPNADRVVVNEAFVREVLGGGDPVGVSYERRTPRGRLRQTIIGVVQDARYVDTRTVEVPVVFVPYQLYGQGVLTIRGTSASDPALWRTLAATNFPALQLVSTTDYPTILYNRSLRDRLLAWLSAFLAALTAAVLTLGLQGVLGYALARRQQEIALRLAVGGPVVKVVAEVFRSAAGITALGAVIGTVVAMALTPVVAPILFQSPSLPAGLTLPLVSLATAWVLTALPAATQVWRMHPGLTLRQQ